MEKIFIKKSILSQLPSSFGHGTVPVLFAENGSMQNSKGKSTSCIIVVNMAGIYFFKSKTFSHHLQLKHFISVFTIDEIQYIDPKRRDISYLNEKFFFSCDHANEAVAQILASKAYLLDIDVTQNPIKLTTFPYKIDKFNSKVPKESLSALRYVCLCLQYSVTPDESIIALFKQVNPKHNTTIQLGSQCSPPPILKCIFTPIIQIEGITSIHFKGFSPYSVCRIAHFMLKKSTSIRTIIFEDYDFFIPQQLRLNSLPSNYSITFIFTHCSIPVTIVTTLINELNKFKGDYQRISFNSIQFTQDSLNLLFESLLFHRCYRTIEMLELDNIDSKDLYNDNIIQNIISIFKHCRFLQDISLSNWTNPLSIGFDLFSGCSTLTNIVLAKQNLTRPFSETFKFPPQIYLLDFTECSFTYLSIQSLFKNLSTFHSPLCLILSQISLPEAHWSSFFDSLKTLPSITCLKELDWSGNRIPLNSTEIFCKYFLETSPIRYLSISYMYNSTKFKELETLFSYIPKNKLWGISLCGNTENNFSNNFKLLIQVLSKLQLTILNINGQKMTDNDSDVLLTYLQKNSSICELSCDDSLISNYDKFFQFYNELIQLKFAAIGKPYIDLKRLSNNEKNRNKVSPSKLENFCTTMRTRQNSTPQTLRSYYLCKINTSNNDMDLDELFQFIQSYPQSLLSYDSYDEYSLSPIINNNNSSMKTLLSRNNEFNDLTLGEIQLKRLVPPYLQPKYTPTGLSTEHGFYSISQNQQINTFENIQNVNNIEEIIKNIKFEPIAKTPEMKEVIELLANSGFELEEEEEESEDSENGRHKVSEYLDIDFIQNDQQNSIGMSKSLESGSFSEFNLDFANESEKNLSVSVDGYDVTIENPPPLKFLPHNVEVDQYYGENECFDDVPVSNLKEIKNTKSNHPLEGRDRNYPPNIKIVDAAEW
ncbi:hypothetical protein GPJ56_002160 [Histomonas meleagridis]|uniref:uncharacterized protein n=1 Tax=Histomonas meleagridis TaxID=135588 RepID=UPI00355998C3|nr:hypothetical protein GPJ56_002160 [Histomonas meleagridis]KAH0806661.1 hypothetical protein GO595_000512 [Histomonas meleagridis]